jgi:hypothetical protein
MIDRRVWGEEEIRDCSGVKYLKRHGGWRSFVYIVFCSCFFICNNSMHTFLRYNRLFICERDMNLDDRTRKFGASRLIDTVFLRADILSTS